MQQPTHVYRALLATLCVAALVTTASSRMQRAHASGSVTYYVSPTGSDSNPGTQASPWKTMAHAAATLTAGQTAIFADGTYNETQQAITAYDGAANNYITMMAQDRGQAHIVWQGLQNVWGHLGIGNNYWTIDGFDFSQNARGSNTQDVLLLVDGPNFNPSEFPVGTNYSNHTTGTNIINNTAHLAYEKCYKFGFADNVTVDNNTCYDITHDGIDFVQGRHVTISNNTIYHIGRTGIFEKGGVQSARVFNNYVWNDAAYVASSGYGAPPNGIELGDTTDANASVCTTQSPACYEEWDGVAYDNVVRAVDANAIHESYSMWGCSNCRIMNNVAIGGQFGFALRAGVGDTQKSPPWSYNPPTSNPVVENNIFYGMTAGAQDPFPSEVIGTTTIDYNDFYNSPSPPTQAHGLAADPLFVNPTSDWRLQAGSPAIGAGTANSFTGYFGEPIDVSHDRAGVNRSTPWDLGVYAYGGNSPAAVPPTATSIPASATPVPPTATSIPASATPVPPTATTPPPPPVFIPQAGQTRFATGFEGNDPQPTWNDTTDFARNVRGVCCGLTHTESSTRREIAHTGGVALMYSGYGAKASQSYSYNKVFDLRGKNITIRPSTTLSYWVYPQNGFVGAVGRDSTHVAIDMIFTDGSDLRDSGAVDQYGVRLHPQYQGDGGHLAVNTWNHVISTIGAKLAGKTIDHILVGYDQPGAGGPYRGYIDDVQISG